MKRGTRSVLRTCPCGCGEQIQPYISPTSNRVEGYPKFIPGHGRKKHRERIRQHYLDNPGTHPSAKPTGSRRLHNAGNGLIYRVIKLDKPARWEYEHRHVLSIKIGRPLQTDEDCHHIDGNPLNNSPDNLEVKSHSEHRRYHASLKPSGWSKKHIACIDCGTSKRAHAGNGKCTRCWQRDQASRLGRWPRSAQRLASKYLLKISATHSRSSDKQSRKHGA